MKQYAIALVMLGAFTATPAMARNNSHLNISFYSPAPVYYAPPVAYYAPLGLVRYAPPCPKRYGYRSHRPGWGHVRHYENARHAPHGYGWHY